MKHLYGAFEFIWYSVCLVCRYFTPYWPNLATSGLYELFVTNLLYCLLPYGVLKYLQVQQQHSHSFIHLNYHSGPTNFMTWVVFPSLTHLPPFPFGKGKVFPR